jgi:hypothetical protein
VTIVGYARVSTTDQDLSIQEAALRAAGCDTIRAEKRSGTTTQGEIGEYQACQHLSPFAPHSMVTDPKLRCDRRITKWHEQIVLMTPRQYAQP